MAITATKNIEFAYTAPKTLKLIETTLPEPEEGYVQCKTLCSLISIGTEMICFERAVQENSHWDKWIQYPFSPGYLSVGEITKINAQTSEYKIGQRICSYVQHRANFNDNIDNIFPIPDEITNHQAAWFGLNNIVQNGLRHVNPVMGETAVVIGLGPLGQIATRLLGNAGLSHLIAIEPSDYRCNLAENNGPTHVVRGTCEDATELLNRITQGQGADMVFDMTGHPAVFQSAHEMLKPMGRLGLIGDVPDPSQQKLSSSILRNSISIIASHAFAAPQRGSAHYHWGKHEMTQYFFELIKTGRLDVTSLNKRIITPIDAPAFYSKLLNHRDKEMGVIIDWESFNAN